MKIMANYYLLTDIEARVSGDMFANISIEAGCMCLKFSHQGFHEWIFSTGIRTQMINRHHLSSSRASCWPSPTLGQPPPRLHPFAVATSACPNKDNHGKKGISVRWRFIFGSKKAFAVTRESKDAQPAC